MTDAFWPRYLLACDMAYVACRREREMQRKEAEEARARKKQAFLR